MPKPVNKKCQECSLLPAEEARQVHGPEGDGCWKLPRCKARRSHYRNRADNLIRRRQRYYAANPRDRGGDRVAVPPGADLSPKPVAYLYLCKKGEAKHTPTHSMWVALWLGDQKLLETEPVHLHGYQPAAVEAYSERVLERLKKLHPRLSLSFAETTYVPVERCKAENCPKRKV